MGFGSKGARVSLASTMRTEGYREVLKKEQMFAERDKARRHTPDNKAGNAKQQQTATTKPATFVYDICRSRTTPFNPRLRRDRYHAPQAEGKDAAPASSPSSPFYRVTSSDIGAGMWTAKHAPPAFGPISCLRSFYDKSHLKVAGDCA